MQIVSNKTCPVKARSRPKTTASNDKARFVLFLSWASKMLICWTALLIVLMLRSPRFRCLRKQPLATWSPALLNLAVMSWSCLLLQGTLYLVSTCYWLSLYRVIEISDSTIGTDDEIPVKKFVKMWFTFVFLSCTFLTLSFLTAGRQLFDRDGNRWGNQGIQENK